MTLPVANASIYGDFSGLEALKQAARDHTPGAIRQVAKEFESLFMQMLLKSMRSAIGPDPIFGGSQMQTYQEMYDNQLAMELTKGHSLGLAEMLVRQLQQQGEIPSTKTASGSSTAAAKSASRLIEPTGSTPSPAASSAASPAAATPSLLVPRAQREAFVHKLWPQACQAAHELGIAPQSLVAQAALETHWGCAMPQGAAGRPSNNLFGMKSSGGWAGAAVSAPTLEFDGRIARPTTASFRAYGSTTQSFNDYVELLKTDPRYSGALNTGNDVQAFAGALQRGGYATDPNYARKVIALAREVAGMAPAIGTPLKLASVTPISPNGIQAF